MRYFPGFDIAQYYSRDASEAFKKYIFKNVMISFFYAKKVGLARLEEVFNFFADNGTEIYLDSGAFSWMVAQGKGKNINIDLDEYTISYAKFINKHRQRISKFFELDIQSVVGEEEYKRLRALLTEHAGCEPALVWHVFDPISKFEEYCNHVIETGERFLAIGGVASARLTGSREVVRLLRELVLYARTRGIKVHGLGITSRISRYIDFDSVDSFTYIRPITDNMAFEGDRGLVSTYGYKNAWMMCVARAKLEQLMYETF
jgi:hypothetical protein